MHDYVVEYLPTRAGRIALARAGSGPDPVVVVPGLLSHVDALWADPSFSRWAGALGRRATVVS